MDSEVFSYIFLISTYPDENTGASILEDDDTDYNDSLDSGLDEINKFGEETNSEEDQVNYAVKLLVLDNDMHYISSFTKLILTNKSIQYSKG